MNYGIEKINAISFKKGTPLFEKIRWLTEAVYTDDTRYFMKGVHVEKSDNKTIMVSTDGRRLHKLEIEDIDIDAGEYQIDTNNTQAVILSTAKEKYDFPNWKSVIPKNKKKFSISFAPKGKNQDTAFSINVAEILKTTGACINQTFLNPLRGNDWKVSFETASKGFVFTSGIMQAVIMPIREVNALEITEEKFEKEATATQADEFLNEVKAMTNMEALRDEFDKAKAA